MIGQWFSCDYPQSFTSVFKRIQVIEDFVDRCKLNHLHVNASKTNEMVKYFCRKLHQCSLEDIQGLNTEMHTDTWAFTSSINQSGLTEKDFLCKKGQNRLHLLTFYYTVEAPAILICRGVGRTERDRKTVKKLVKKVNIFSFVNHRR